MLSYFTVLLIFKVVHINQYFIVLLIFKGLQWIYLIPPPRTSLSWLWSTKPPPLHVLGGLLAVHGRVPGRTAALLLLLLARVPSLGNADLAALLALVPSLGLILGPVRQAVKEGNEKMLNNNLKMPRYIKKSPHENTTDFLLTPLRARGGGSKSHERRKRHS